MNIEAKDYCIVSNEKGKKVLIQVTACKSGNISGVLEASRYIEGKEAEYLSVPLENLVVNLGAKPAWGNVYGCKVEPLQANTTTKWGDLWVFRPEVDDQVLKSVVKAINLSHKRMHAKGLNGFAEELRFELRPGGGKYAGSYTIFPQKQERFDKVSIFPKDLAGEIVEDLLYHEYAHGLEFHLFTDKLRARWTKLYHSYSVIKMAKKKDLDSAKASIKENNSALIALTTLNEWESSVVQACIDYIAVNHYIDLNRLDLLLSTGSDLDDFWPEVDELPVSTIESPIGEYSEKNPTEFFCEAFRIYMGGRDLPVKIQKAMKKTLSLIKTKKRVYHD